MTGRAAVAFWLLWLRRLGVGMVLLYALVVLALGGTRAAKPTLYAVIVLWITGVGIAAVRTARKKEDAKRAASAFLRGELVATNIVLALVAGELALQGSAAVLGRSFLVDAGMDARRLVPGRDYGGGLVGNRLGYPGPEFPAEKTAGLMRIAALGDSFAVGPAVPFADCYLTRLGQELPGVRVGNFGLSGAGPHEYRLILERDVLRIQPDLVLLSVFVGNDITETLGEPRHLHPCRHALGLLGQRSWRLVREWWRGAGPAAACLRAGETPLSPQTFREVEARRLVICRRQPEAALERKWQHALGELDRLVGACRKHGVPLAVVLIPDEFQVNDAVLEAARLEVGWSREEIDLEAPQRRLAEFFAVRNVPCLDLLPAMRSTPACYAPCDTHWNVTGNHLAAREIGVWLKGLKRGSG
jgi:hypothetical protein